MCDEIWLHAEVDEKLSAFVTTPWTEPRLHHEPSGSMNFTNFMEGVLLIVSTGFVHFALGSIYGSTLFVHGFFAVRAAEMMRIVVLVMMMMFLDAVYWH